MPISPTLNAKLEDGYGDNQRDRLADQLQTIDKDIYDKYRPQLEEFAAQLFAVLDTTPKDVKNNSQVKDAISIEQEKLVSSLTHLDNKDTVNIQKALFNPSERVYPWKAANDDAFDTQKVA